MHPCSESCAFDLFSLQFTSLCLLRRPSSFMFAPISDNHCVYTCAPSVANKSNRLNLKRQCYRGDCFRKSPCAVGGCRILMYGGSKIKKALAILLRLSLGYGDFFSKFEINAYQLLFELSNSRRTK